jgi:PAS domain S-box-containing protein
VNLDEENALIGFDFAPVGLAILRNRVVVQCNKSFATLFGYTKQQLIGLSTSVLYPTHDEFERIGELGLNMLSQKNNYVGERIMKHRTGETFWCRVRGQSLTPKAPFDHSVWSFADLSETRPIVGLTRRERQIAMFLVDGKTSKEIAGAINISVRTAEAHRANLMRKLDAKNVAECIAKLSWGP